MAIRAKYTEEIKRRACELATTTSMPLIDVKEQVAQEFPGSAINIATLRHWPEQQWWKEYQSELRAELAAAEQERKELLREEVSRRAREVTRNTLDFACKASKRASILVEAADEAGMNALSLTAQRSQDMARVASGQELHEKLTVAAAGRTQIAVNQSIGLTGNIGERTDEAIVVDALELGTV